MLNNLEKIEDNKVKLEIEVAASEVDTALEKAYRQVVKKVDLPGFRKGKVPRHILESRFGPEILHEDALQNLVPAAYDEAVSEAEIEPIGRPDFELVQIEEGKSLIFKATVEVLPPVELGDYKGLEAEQEEVVIDDEQVNRSLQNMQEQHARLIPVEDGTAGEGDMVVIDFQGFLEGEEEPFEGGEAENYSLELGSGSFIPGFEEQLVGSAPGDEREVKVTFPQDYRKEDLAGKDVIFKVAVKQIKRKQLPDLNDDFVKEVSEENTLEDFKLKIKEQMEKTARERAKTNLEEDLIKKAAEVSTVNIPDTLVERQLDRMMEDMDQYLNYQGLNLEKFAEMSGKTLDEMRQERKEEASGRAKSNLILDAIAKKEGFTVTESELDDKIAEIAEAHGDEAGRVRDIFQKQGRLDVLREEIKIRKAIDLLVEEAKIKKLQKKT